MGYITVSIIGITISYILGFIHGKNKGYIKRVKEEENTKTKHHQ
ncbi:hypothetical protein R8G64_12000 [Tenacibaculum maritimum]|nr:hypothetical protein [Tenacibaculum maritimum]MDB0603103.1 hypothetical protein [Tenacibaculum maritimum]MDB0603250.1 hypothetical protein [Tenacibaculum maritimum]